LVNRVIKLLISRNWIYLIVFGFTVFASAHAQDWPLHDARWTVLLQKDIDAVPPPHEPSDPPWFHLHRAHPTLPDALSNTIAPVFFNGDVELDPADSGIQMQ